MYLKEQFLKRLNENILELEKLGLISKEVKDQFLKKRQENKNIEQRINILNKKKNMGSQIKNKSEKADQLKKERKDAIILKKKILHELEQIFFNCPNLPLPATPLEKTNIIFHKEIDFIPVGLKKYTSFLDTSNLSKVKHCESLNLVLLQDDVADLQDSLIYFMKESAVKNGFSLLGNLPLLIPKKTLFCTGHLPKFESTLFKIENLAEELYLTPTGECSVLLSLQDKKIKTYNYVCETDCFRLEKGSRAHLKHFARVNQFKKVELVSFYLGNDEKQLKKLLNWVSPILEKLELEYRFVELPIFDLPFSSAKTIDIEVFYPISQVWVEVSSVSVTTFFQTERLNIKSFKNELLKASNASGFALPRIICALLERFQKEDGSIDFKQIKSNIS